MTKGELKTIEGELASIDLEKRFFTLADRNGIIYPKKIIYGPQFDQTMAKQKIGYYEKVPVEVDEDSDEAVLQDIPFVKRPDDWPRRAQPGGKRGGNWQPRNDRAIMLQVCYKEACETSRHNIQQLTQEFDVDACNAQMDRALERAIKDAARLMKEADG
jgi:hypothetical protein